MDAEFTGVPPIPPQEVTVAEQVVQVSQSPTETPAQQALEVFGVAPALFVENQGQWSDPSLRYVHNGNGIDVAVTDTGIVFQVARTELAAEGIQDVATAARGGLGPYSCPVAQAPSTQMLRFSASFVGANQVRPVGLDRSQSEFNYFVGRPDTWRANVPAYESVAYEGLYEGIDLHVRGLRSHLKYEFHVAPGADWSQIAVRYDGIGGLSLADDGSLVLDLGGDWGAIVDDAPRIYQVISGRQIEIAGCFRLLDERTFAFELAGTYDPACELVIDPNLVWSTYLGGSDADWGYGLAVDASDNVYVTGQTQSSDWTSDGFDTTYNGVSDVFVAKFGPAGNCLWSTYLGGSDADWGNAVAVDSSDSVYVTGQTRSPDWTSDGFDTTYNGVSDAFVAKLSPSGACVWSTYVGGSDGDWGYGVALDSSDDIYVTGQTWSADWVIGGFDMVYNGTSDAFVAKLNPSGACLWSTYVGGTDWDWGHDIAVDSSDDVYVTGATLSADWTNGGFDTSYGGVSDAFVAKLSLTGDGLWSTYVGGSEGDWGYGIAVDSSNNVYVTGATLSADWTNGGFDTTYDGVSDAFVAKLSSTGDGLWSTYLGGSAGDWGYGIAVEPSGNVCVTGTTESSDWTNGGFDTSYNGVSDAFVARLSPTGGGLWSTYLGGSEGDGGYAIAVDSSGYLYATGQTQSSDWIGGGSDTTSGGGGDAFLAKIADTTPPSPNPSTWSTEPYATGATSIRMVATTATDASGVEYYFHETSGNPGATDSGWQDSDTYEDTGLSPSTTYTYQVKTRDKSAAHNETSYSPARSATTQASADTTPPSPNPSTWSTEPYAAGATSIRMVATTATDAGGVEYYFHETSSNPGATDSGWQDSDTYEDTGLSPGTSYVYQVATRDKSPSQNEGAYSTSASATTPSPIYRFWSPVHSRHFYTINEAEKNKLINSYANVWTYEGLVYYAFSGSTQPNTSAVYRFWSGTLNAHFYTMSSGERDKLINKYSNVWTFEGTAFYAYADGFQPEGACAVYRFWSNSLSCHFYTVSAAERDKLINKYSNVWTYEIVAWYAFIAT